MIMGSNKEERWAKGSGWSLGGFFSLRWSLSAHRARSLKALEIYSISLFPILL